MDDVKRHCDELGRDYNTVEKTSLGTVTLAPGKDTVQGIIDRATNLQKMGFTHCIFNMTNVFEIAPLETFGKEIIPALQAL